MYCQDIRWRVKDFGLGAPNNMFRIHATFIFPTASARVSNTLIKLMDPLVLDYGGDSLRTWFRRLLDEIPGLT